MEKSHYADFFTVPQNYQANMTREAINETPEKWLEFYPHIKYVEFFDTLLEAINGGTKSIWLTGNYGTGKTNAALVTQKLFMDDKSRVQKWFEQCKAAIQDSEALQSKLFSRRSEGTLVVYDYNASGTGPNEDFLVRLERSIVAALHENDMIIPAKANLDEIIHRLRREGRHFFTTRDAMQEELTYLGPQIATVEQLIAEMQKAQADTDVPNDLLGDVQRVFHKDNIYLDISVPTFKKWISNIVSVNKIKRIIYIFDEFSDFIDSNKEHLKTFEDVAENPSISSLYFIPVTHMSINAYWAEGSASAKKANDRFHFRNLQMPNDMAFKLAAHAMKPNPNPEIAAEWKREKDDLWQAVRSIAEMHFKADDVSNQSFYDILPIHPMAAFLLKFLSESARSNQRSIFEYLKGSADGQEFQEFIYEGGPSIANKQYLTADYLWKYFIEREDLGLNKEIINIRSEFERIRGREFQNKDDDDEDIRVLKSVLLFCLLARLNPDGHERLRPTVQNIELAFQGDGAIVGVAGIIKNLANKQCFSVVNGNIELFATSVGGVELQKKVDEYKNKFHDLLSIKMEEMIKSHLKNTTSTFSDGRFDIRASDVNHTTLTNFTHSTREKYGKGQNKDNGTICLWFVAAKNKEEQLQIPKKINGILTQLRDHRIMMFTFPNNSFCERNQDLWKDYVVQYANYMLENDSTAKGQRKRACERLEHEWFDEIKKQSTGIRAYYFLKEQVIVNDTSWGSSKQLLEGFVRNTLPYCVDYLPNQITAFGRNSLKTWANAGIQFDATSGQYKQLVNHFKSQGINADENWFTQNPSHPLAQIRSLFDKKVYNTIGKGSTLSVRKVYIELQRAPYGMKYNALSAFVLGIALRHFLDRGYQWDNLQKTGSLDSDVLAEIIESVVKDDGQDKIKGEKLICRLSKEEKAFVEIAPMMFGITNIGGDSRVEDALLSIQNRVEKISGRVPLWVLPEYIRSVDEPYAEMINEVLDMICKAGSTSSKSGKIDERSNAVKEVGRIICNDGNIVDIIAGYIKPENFVTAFQIYVDRTAPMLNDLAVAMGDNSHSYCEAILDKVAETSGLLWTPTDINKEIDETIQEYEIIKLLTPIAGFPGFVPYKTAIDVLRNAVLRCKIPRTFITSAVHIMSPLISNIETNGKARDIKDALEQNVENVKLLFFDVSRAKPVELLKQRLTGITISNEGMLAIYDDLPIGFSKDEAQFLSDVRSRIERYTKESVAQKIKAEWERVTGTESPSIWAIDNKLPARFVLHNVPEADDIIAALQNPENYSSDRLDELLNILNGITPPTISECQYIFIVETVPSRFAKFNINLPSLLEFLESEYGKQPNDWGAKPDIRQFIKKQYKSEFAPQVTQNIKNTSAEDIKARLLQLVQDDSHLGLLFLD